jgi:phage anti-repressor protein
MIVRERLIGHKKMLSVEARELHQKLGVKKPFTQWLEQYTSKGDWRKDNDFSVFNLEVKNPDGGGRPGIDAVLSLQMGEHIAMLTRTPKGRDVREEFRKARDERDALLASADPLEKYPELRAIKELLLVTAEARDEAALARQEAQAAEVRAVRAESKADIAIEDLHRMTVQEFILKNGLYRQFPPPQYVRIGTWLGDYSQRYGLRVRKAPVVGKPWDAENSYELQAFGAWLDYEQKRPHQIALVDTTPAS